MPRIGLMMMFFGFAMGVTESVVAGPAITFDITIANGLLANPPLTLGYQFRTNQEITVTQLGVFNDSNQIWRDLRMDCWWTLFALRRAQYGDTTFGHDVRKAERSQRQWRNRLIQNSRAPIHAGFDWER